MIKFIWGHLLYSLLGRQHSRGDTIKMFKKYSGGQYRKIMAFEPSRKNGKLINEVDNRIIVINKGVWNENCEVSFQEDGEGSELRALKGCKI